MSFINKLKKNNVFLPKQLVALRLCVRWSCLGYIWRVLIAYKSKVLDSQNKTFCETVINRMRKMVRISQRLKLNP